MSTPPTEPRPTAPAAFTVEYVGGSFPTQAWGRTADDRPYYFRYRGGVWTLYVGESQWSSNPHEWPELALLDQRLVVAQAALGDSLDGHMDDNYVLALLATHLPEPTDASTTQED